MIPYGRHHITDQDIEAVINVLKSDFLTQGPQVKEFEQAFAQYVGSKYAVGVANGTAALHLSVLALGLSREKKVITTPISFVATSNSVLYGGGEVVFSDIDPHTYCLDPNKVEDLLKKNPDAYCGIAPVDFAGHPADLEAFHSLAEKYGLWVMEDACHAPGATYNKKNVGSGIDMDLSVFSFHPVKHIACGEGGMITTNNAKLYEKLMLLRTHGITRSPAEMKKNDGGWYYEMQELGFNYRLPDILSALGHSQLARASENLKKRQAIAAKYMAELAHLPIKLPQVKEGTTHAFHLFVIQTERRKELFDYLRERGIFAQIHYIPIHQQPYYVNRYGQQKFEVADSYYEKCLSIPMYHSLSSKEQDEVISALNDYFR